MFGSKNDISVTCQIELNLNKQCLNFAGKLTLSETVSLISSNGVISNNSGLIHMAAALNKPLVAIYGSTSPTFTPPLGQRSRKITVHLPCSPCFKQKCPYNHYRCMELIMPNDILNLLNIAIGQ